MLATPRRQNKIVDKFIRFHPQDKIKEKQQHLRQKIVMIQPRAFNMRIYLTLLFAKLKDEIKGHEIKGQAFTIFLPYLEEANNGHPLFLAIAAHCHLVAQKKKRASLIFTW